MIGLDLDGWQHILQGARWFAWKLFGIDERADLGDLFYNLA